MARKEGRPNVVVDEILQKIRYAIIGLRLAGTVISQKMIIAIEAGVIKTNELNILKEFGGSLELTENWAGNALRVLDWVERIETTEKVELSAKFLEEEKFSFQHSICKFVLWHNIPRLDLVLNIYRPNPTLLYFTR